MANNVKITNKSPFECDIAGIKIASGVTEVEVRDPVFFAKYVNGLKLEGLMAEALPVTDAKEVKNTGKKGE